MEQRLWRTSPAARVFGWLLVAMGLVGVGAVVVVSVVVDDFNLIAALAIALYSASWAWGGYAGALRPNVEVGPAGIIIRNPWRTYMVDWDEIAGIEPGYSGLRIERSNGPPVTAWAVQKSNWRSAFGDAKTRADSVAEELSALAGQARGYDRDALLPTPEERLESRRDARWTMIIGTALLIVWGALRVVLGK